MRHTIAAVAATLAAAAALPVGTATAATTVAVAGDQIVVTGGEEGSDLSLSGPESRSESPRAYSVRDLATSVTPGTGCAQEGDQHGVYCSLPGDAAAARIRVDLGGGMDRAFARPETTVSVFFSGGDGPDFMAGGAGADRFEGGPGNDFMWGDEGPAGDAVTRAPDEFLGGEGTDRVSYTGHRADRIRVTLDGVADDGAPGEGDNVHGDVEDLQGDPSAENALYGTDAANFLWGGQRNDVIAGGGGADRIIGDRGDDTLDARDGVADSVSCGDGFDRVTNDLGDGLEPGCEVFDSPPPPPAPEPEPERPAAPPAAFAFPVTITSASARPSRRGVFTVTLACGGATGDPDCAGRLRLASAKRVRIGGRRRVLSLGPKAFRIPAGRTARIALRLSKPQRRALVRAGRVALVARAVEDAAPRREVSRTVSLRRRG